MYQMGFIGTGNMGSAIAQAAAKVLPSVDLLLVNRTRAKAERLAERLGCDVGDDEQAARESKYVLLGVKPQMMERVFQKIAPVLQERKDRFLLVTMAAGLTIERICQLAGGDYPVIRIMPNTPCAIGAGTVLCCKNEAVTEEEYTFFKAALQKCGTLVDLPEHLIDAGSAISGCSPAYVYTFIESMADAGVSCGLTRQDALSLAAATVNGAARMVQESGEHPAQLRDRVCSPGGSTIAGVLSLENDGFRGAVANCIRAAYERTKELGNL